MVKGMADPDKDMMLSRNLPGIDLGKIASAFIDNDKYRQQTFAKTRWYHEVLSFSALDRDMLDNEKLETIAREYISRRSSKAMCFAVSHIGEAHRHIHLVLSGTEYKSKKVLRMSDKEFKELRLGMEDYQKQMFPELKHSLVYGKEKKMERAKTRDRNAAKERAFQAKRRSPEKLLEKERLMEMVQQSFNKARSIQGFIKNLESYGISTYMWGGKVAGVVGKRKYRFSTLGIDREMLRSLERLRERQMEMDRLRGRSKGKAFEMKR